MDLQVCPLWPEVEVCAVLPTILLLREIQGEHPDQDSVFVVLRGLTIAYLSDARSRFFHDFMGIEAGRSLWGEPRAFWCLVFTFRDGGS